jgi:hypothetical protein
MSHPTLSAPHQGATRIIIGLDVGLTFSKQAEAASVVQADGT